MNSVVVLEWTFSPPDYFETRREIKQDDYTMIIADGRVEVKIDSAVYDKNLLMRNALHEELNRRFLGVQLCNHKPYELSNPPTPNRVYPNGHRHVSLAGTVTAVCSVKAEDADYKRDRIKKGEDLGDLFIKHQKDEVLKLLLKSFNASMSDPDDELVHLYEIRDALSTKFGSEKAARNALKISHDNWSRFGQLCNDEPLRQGRHRGKKYEARDATNAELSEARRIAQAMIEGYLRYLDSGQTSTA